MRLGCETRGSGVCREAVSLVTSKAAPLNHYQLPEHQLNKDNTSRCVEQMGKTPRPQPYMKNCKQQGNAENERNDPQERTALVIPHQMAGPENICVSTPCRLSSICMCVCVCFHICIQEYMCIYKYMYTYVCVYAYMFM